MLGTASMQRSLLMQHAGPAHLSGSLMQSWTPQGPETTHMARHPEEMQSIVSRN